jgi:hypothetical protein
MKNEAMAEPSADETEITRLLDSAINSLGPHAGNEMQGGGWERGVLHCILVAKDCLARHSAAKDGEIQDWKDTAVRSEKAALEAESALAALREDKGS